MGTVLAMETNALAMQTIREKSVCPFRRAVSRASLLSFFFLWCKQTKVYISFGSVLFV
jgi:hypothetical protein